MQIFSIQSNKPEFCPKFGSINIKYAQRSVKAPIRALFSDIDGTIYNNHYKVPAKTLDAIERLQEADVHVILTTGRGYRSLDNMFADFGMKSDFAVTESGTIIVDDKKNKIYQNTLSFENVQKIIEIAKYLKQEGLFRLSFDGDSYVEGTNEFFKNTNISVHPIKSFKQILDKGLLPARAIFAKRDSRSFADIEPLKSYLMSVLGDELNVFVSGHKYCEVTNKGVSKASGIEVLRKFFGYDYGNMASIGDAENDLSMSGLLTAKGGVSICMGNGTKEMKRVSRFVTDSVDNDGFAKAADTILEINKRFE